MGNSGSGLMAAVVERWREYWFGYRISYALLVVFRAVFFAAFAFDCWTQIHRAIKYVDCARFNVSHLPPSAEARLASFFASALSLSSSLFPPWLLAPLRPALDHLSWYFATLWYRSWTVRDFVAWASFPHRPQLAAFWHSLAVVPPSPPALVLCWAVMAFVALRVALGRFRRWEVVLLAGLQWYHYYSSQLNLYQHEHLLALLLVIWCLVDWPSRADDEAGGESEMLRSVSCWPMRLIIVQLAVVYFWTAVAKMDPVWLSADFLPSLFSPRFNAVLEAHLHPLLESSGLPLLAALAPDHLWRLAAASVIVVELLLVGLLLAAPGPWLNAVLFPFGVGLHFSMEASGLQIGHFSYFMAVLYLLLLPRRLTAALSAAMALADRAATWLGCVWAGWSPRRSRLVAALVAVVDAALAAACVAGGHYLVWTQLRFEKATLVFLLAALDAVLLVSALCSAVEFVVGFIHDKIASRTKAAAATTSKGALRRRSGGGRLLASGVVFLLCCGAMVAFEARTQQFMQLNQTGSQDALKMGNLTLAVEFLEKAVAAASPPSADMIADLAILHEGLAAGREGSHDDQAAARYYALALGLDGDNIKAQVGRLRRVDRDATKAMHDSQRAKTTKKKNEGDDSDPEQIRRSMCAVIEDVGRKAEAVVASGCGYFDAADCETTRGFALNYALRRVLPPLARKWGC